ncbi:Pycsar system effector family protein [Chitinophaga sp.]
MYYLGVVLGHKYKLLRISYNIFMFGLIISVFAFLIAAIFFPVKA